MTALRSVRFPLHDLERLLGWPLAVDLAEDVGATVAAVQQWKIRGVSHRRADQLAVRFGYHGAEVWGPAFFDDVKVPADDPRAQHPARVRPTIHGAVGSLAEMAGRDRRRREEMATVGAGGRP